jgi:uncharacterized membrane protein YdcZ (DUF606 family)
MTQAKKSKSGLGGGIFIAIGMLSGAVIGAYAGQPSAGMVIGFLSGSVIALAVWAIDRKRQKDVR